MGCLTHSHVKIHPRDIISARILGFARFLGDKISENDTASRKQSEI